MSKEISVKDPIKLRSIQKLCDIENPYTINEDIEALFALAMKEAVEWHSENCQFYRNFLDLNNFIIENYKLDEIAKNIPFLHANFFKVHEILSVPREEIVLHLTSSGTTGQKSQMFFDDWSIRSSRRMVDFVFNYFGLITPNIKSNYFLFAYEPIENFNVGTTNTNLYLTSYAPANKTYFALRYNGAGKHEFDMFGSIEKIKEFAEENIPVRFNGFPAFMYFTLSKMKDLGVPPMKLHPESLVIFGGGWKGYADKAIPKMELYYMIHNQLGIPLERIRQTFGSVEHSIPYIECEHHNLHIPIWSKLFIRDVKTLEILGYHKQGYLNFVTPYITSVPAISVLMGDIGELYPPEECSCGIKTPFFIVTGRAGITQNKSCAISAAELLKGK